jgi:hypothetical protein
VGVLQIRWDKGGTVITGDYIFIYGKETKILNWERIFFANHEIESAVRIGTFVSDRMSYIVLRGRWFYNIVSNVHTPSENSDDSKDGFMRI